MFELLISLLLALFAVLGAQLDRAVGERRELPSVQRSIVRTVSDAAPKKVAELDCERRTLLQSA